MDAQLKELIETIKAEGVQSAEKQSAEIVEKAEQRAKDIVSEAEQKAERIVQDAQREASRREQSGKEMLNQAGRDLVLQTESGLRSVFDAVVRAAVAESYSQKVVEEAIVKLVEAWAEQGATDLKLLLPEGDRDDLEKSLRGRLAETFKEGVNVQVSPAIRSGFRVSTQDGKVYYDFTAEGVAEALTAYLNPRLSDIVRAATQEKQS